MFLDSEATYVFKCAILVFVARLNKDPMNNLRFLNEELFTFEWKKDEDDNETVFASETIMDLAMGLHLCFETRDACEIATSIHDEN